MGHTKYVHGRGGQIIVLCRLEHYMQALKSLDFREFIFFSFSLSSVAWNAAILCWYQDQQNNLYVVLITVPLAY